MSEKEAHARPDPSGGTLRIDLPLPPPAAATASCLPAVSFALRVAPFRERGKRKSSSPRHFDQERPARLPASEHRPFVVQRAFHPFPQPVVHEPHPLPERPRP